MADEKQPLLPFQRNRSPSPPARARGSNSSSSSSITSSVHSVQIQTYGGVEATSDGNKIPTLSLPNRMTYTWSDLNVFSSKSGDTSIISRAIDRSVTSKLRQRHIIKNVSGVARPGELLAILGSSGAGKTTLLNALTFRTGRDFVVSGLRCVNGVVATPRSLTSELAYVQQDDLFIGSLTVREHLVFQACVRMDRHISMAQRMRGVEEVICDLQLSKCQNTRIGVPGRIEGISGGERKRLSFGAEVLTNPPLMFCDEPTSGLDSFMALSVVQVLKNMARSGKTVVCTVHQPSSELYAMFDKVLFMAEGRIAFLGTRDEAENFFKQLEAPCPRNYNPADYFIELLAIAPGREESCRQAVNLICEKFERSEMGVHITLEAASTTKYSYHDVWTSAELLRSPYKASWCSQFRAVFWRSWLSVLKEPLLIKVRLTQTLIVSLLIGLIYFGQVLDKDGVMNINGVLFLFLTNMTFQNVMAVVNVFCSELPVFLREHRNGMYRTDVYFLCKTMAEVPLFVLVPILFAVPCYHMIGLNADSPERFFIACGIVVLVCNVATSFGYLVSCASNSLSMALSMGPPLIIPFLLFGGFFLNIKSIPIYFRWLSYMSWFRYGNEALLINQWRNVSHINCTDVAERANTCPSTGGAVLQIFHFRESNFMWDIGGLCMLIFVFRLFAFLALVLKTYRQH